MFSSPAKATGQVWWAGVGFWGSPADDLKAYSVNLRNLVCCASSHGLRWGEISDGFAAACRDGSKLGGRQEAKFQKRIKGQQLGGMGRTGSSYIDTMATEHHLYQLDLWT